MEQSKVRPWSYSGEFIFHNMSEEDRETIDRLVETVGNSAYHQGRMAAYKDAALHDSGVVVREQFMELEKEAFKRGQQEAFQEMLEMFEKDISNPKGSDIVQWSANIATKAFIERMKMQKEQEEDE